MDLNHRPPGPEPGALARLRYAPTDTLRPNFRPKQDSQINIASRSRARQLYLRAISLLVGLLIANRYWDLFETPRITLVAAVSGKRGKRYLKRQQLLELGEPAFLYLTEIVHRRPGQWFHDVDRLHDILQNHGAEVLRRAMEQGLQDQVFSATYIESFLQRSLVFQEEIP
jgi:hypothetical protein